MEVAITTLCPKSILEQLPAATQILREHNTASFKASFTLKVFKKAVIDSDDIYYWSAAIHYAANDSPSSSIVNKGGSKKVCEGKDRKTGILRDS